MYTVIYQKDKIMADHRTGPLFFLLNLTVFAIPGFFND